MAKTRKTQGNQRNQKKQGKQRKQRKTQRGGGMSPFSRLSQVLPTGSNKITDDQQKCLHFFVKEDKVCDINTLKDCRATIENMLKTQPELYPFYVIMKNMIN